MRLRKPLILLAAVLAVVGLAWPWLGLERSAPLSLVKANHDSGFAYSLAFPQLPEGKKLPGDDNEHPARSPVRILENEVRLSAGHSLHGEIRAQGGGRYSHWGDALWISASDNSDPRSNGRKYSIAYDEHPAPAYGWALLLASAALFGFARRVASRMGGPASAALPRPSVVAARDWVKAHWAPTALLLALAGCALALGPERSGWILITQPLDLLTATNSLVGFTGFMNGELLHKENHSAFLQVAFFAGADVTPDFYFRRPLYPLLALLITPFCGVANALLIMNLAAWAAAAWLTHRFTRGFYGDEQAARWATLFAVAGIGFVVHVLDLSAHLLAFTVYMAGVVILFESDVWRSRVDGRTHVAIGAFLALACLQYNTGIALVAGYALVALRHNRLRHIVPVCLAALASQAIWGAIVGEVFTQRRGMPLPDLGEVELRYLRTALAQWADIFAAPMDEMIVAIARLLLSFATFEAPWVVLLGAVQLIAGAVAGGPERARVRFALPFIVLPLAAAMVFGPYAPARGYLVYGISIFFFAGAGRTLAGLVRRREAVFGPVAGLLVVASIAWSTAHFGNVLGPAKAYFLGIEHAQHLFVPNGWEAQSLTNSEPTPGLFGGTSRLVHAESRLAVVVGQDEQKDARYALPLVVIFVVLSAWIVAASTRIPWTATMGAALLLTLGLLIAGRASDTRSSFAFVEQVHRLDAGTTATVEIPLGTEVRKRLVAGIEGGSHAALFGAYYRGSTPPTATMDGSPIKVLGSITKGLWLLDPSDLVAAIRASRAGYLSIRFQGGEGLWLGGWQPSGLQGRRFLIGKDEQTSGVFPAVELRLLRDLEGREPFFFAF